MKHMMLREPDRQLLLHLHDHLYLSREFISKYIYTDYKSPTSIYKRLDTLRSNGYIKSFSLQVDPNNHHPSNVYTLTKFGVDAVENLRGSVHWQPEWSKYPPHSWLHSLMIAEVVKSYEFKGWNLGIEVKEFIPEARAQFDFETGGRKAYLKPDGIMVLGKSGTERGMGVMIEMERSYAKKERTLRKIDQYNEFFSRLDELQGKYERKVAFDVFIQGWKVLFIAGTEAKMHKLLRDMAEETPEVTTLVAFKGDIERDPFGAIYRDVTDPDNLVTL